MGIKKTWHLNKGTIDVLPLFKNIFVGQEVPVFSRKYMYVSAKMLEKNDFYGFSS
jgi:hypothetical protein